MTHPDPPLEDLLSFGPDGRLHPETIRNLRDLERLEVGRPRYTLENAQRMRAALQRLRQPSIVPTSELPARRTGTLRLMTLNAAHGRSVGSHQALLPRATVEANLDGIAQEIRAAEADIVALQEADGPSAWSGRFDHVNRVRTRAGFEDAFRGDHNPFGRGRLPLACGTALMARQKIADPSSRRFASSWRCTKGFVRGRVRVPEWDGEIDVVSLHLDFLTPRIRRRQVLDLVEDLREHVGPLVVMGDLNCSWHLEARTMELLTRSLGLRSWDPSGAAPTFPASAPRFRLDWILISEDLEFVSHHTLERPVSDHLPVVADVRRR